MLWYAFLYGVLTIGGGVMGFVKAQSMMSLLAGAVSGLLIVVFAALYKKGNVAGYYGLLSVSVVLGGWFLTRYLETGAVMPALMMVVLSAVNLVGFLLFARPTQKAQSQA